MADRYNRKIFNMNKLRARLKNTFIATLGYIYDADKNMEGLLPSEHRSSRGGFHVGFRGAKVHEASDE